MSRALACLLLLLSAAAARSDYPEIRRLSSEDVLFRQLQQDLQSYYKAINRGRPALSGAGSVRPGDGSEDQIPPLRFFSLARPEKMDLFSLSARLNLPYDTLATLNGISGPLGLERLQRLVVPNLPGLFVPEKPLSSFEEILAAISAGARRGCLPVVVGLPGGSRRFGFYPGQSFVAVERAFFLNILFRYPLPMVLISSAYGPRSDPLTGSQEFHHGVDLAAPTGTEVYAARDGWVEEAGWDPELGYVVVLGHEGGYQTVYGHLSEILVALKQRVRSGMIIGKVGSTGQSTGAHLHFEVRRKGSSRDPIPLLPKGNGDKP
jgi:murein DD-endopeptidase MepM/ murein hydrolase activator NlpD